MSDDDSGVAPIASRRQRRQKHKDSGRSAALEALRNARLKGEKAGGDTGELEPVYDEVDEKDYSKIIKNRQDDDWIVDDDGAGYADDGREIFDDFEDESGRKRNSSRKENRFKPKNPNLRDPNATNQKGIKNFFGPGAKLKDEKNNTASNDNLLEEMLGQLHSSVDTGAKTPKPKLQTFKPPFRSKSPTQTVNPFAKGRQPVKRDPSSPLKQSPSKANHVKMARKEQEEDNGTQNAIIDENSVSIPIEEVSEMQVDDENGEKLTNGTTSTIAAASHVENVEMGPELRGFTQNTKEESQHLQSRTSWSVEPSADVSMDKQSLDRSNLPLDEENNLVMYWLDGYEDHIRNPGTIYLFGRVWSEQSGSFVSCCLVVKNIERVVFFLPRATRFSKGVETEVEVSIQDVYNEVLAYFNKKNMEFRNRPIIKRFAFDSEIPSEAKYLEVRYSSKYSALPSDLSGDTFSRVFGTTTTALEFLLLDKNMRGPGWISVKNPDCAKSHVSWCTYEATLDGAKQLSVLRDNNRSLPTVCAVSLNLVSAPNPKTRHEELIGAALLVYRKHQLDKPFPKTIPTEFYCFFTKPSASAMPFDFKQHLERHKMNRFVQTVGNERALLSLLLAKIQKIDPDLIIGHDLLGYGLGLLAARLSSIKLPNWSRISRLRRGGTIPRFSSSKAAQTELMVGRLCADCKIAAMELVRCRSYDLSSLVAQLLEKERSDVLSTQITAMYSSSQQLVELINWMMEDASYALSIMSDLNALQLFVQITQIVGGVMSRTLMGGRSERNEYLLLHAFYDKGYICPDKFFFKKKQHQQERQEVEEGDDEHTPPTASRKKPTYTGGLVLDPKKGLYDTFILLLDFNSLYPSIIQEFNICFTTVDRNTANSQEDNNIPNVPNPCLEPGILPTEIRKLVESRREVKKLMKVANISTEQYTQYDIRQMALKLTANSMYGCLGFGHSRFYAKPLAALVTAKGREILLHTKELVEKTGLSVIYGDTDSIMINSNSRDFDDVMALGKKVKAEVNKLYRLLELDIDGVYKSLLLLKKKKYAGVTLLRSSDGTQKEKKEMKGLDMVRRDWSDIAREAGTAVLDEILSGKSRDEIIECVHQYLGSLGEQMKAGQVQLDKFQISKQLTKAPSEYTDKKAQAHVLVANRLNAQGGYHLAQGDTVAYVICQDGSNNSVAQRAYHISELKNDEKLIIDMNYYLSQQVHPVVSRLCEPIEGTDAAQIAQCLGLDPTSYKQRLAAAAAVEEEEDLPLGYDLDFESCTPFSFSCLNPNCSNTIAIGSCIKGEDVTVEYGLHECNVCKCPLTRMAPVLVNMLDITIRNCVNKYYQEVLVCEDATCGTRSRAVRVKMSVNGGKPNCPVCGHGTMEFEFTEKMLYKQLAYFQEIFDLEKEMEKRTDTEKKKLLAVDDKEDVHFAYKQLYECATLWAGRSAYTEVDLQSIFAVLSGRNL